MKRRTFLRSAAAAAALAAWKPDSLVAASTTPQLAITMDDPKTTDAAGTKAGEINSRILDALRRHHLHATLFVCGMRVDSPEGHELLRSWNDAGHTLGNHSYSHLYLHSDDVTLQQYCDDIVKGEAVVRDFSRFRKIFRYPYFKEGDTAEKRDGVRRFLVERGYSRGPATIDASDWAIDSRMAKRLTADPHADTQPYLRFYLEHLWERARFYDDLAVKVLGRRPAHTILVHHSLLNAMFLSDVLDMFRSRGWKLISADEAYRDPVYKAAPGILPAGESLIWALAKETGRFDSILRYPGEDSVYEDPKMDQLGL